MKKIRVLAIMAALSLMMMISAFAANPAWRNYNLKIPTSQGDVQTTVITRTNPSTDMKYFIASLSSSSTLASVHVWTENSLGKNLSSPYYVLNKADQKHVAYTTTPDTGTNVRLNLDNPEYSTATYTASGSWTPN